MVKELTRPAPALRQGTAPEGAWTYLDGEFVPILIEDDRLVEPGLLRLGLGERGVHVGACDLAPGGDRVVVGAPP